MTDESVPSPVSPLEDLGYFVEWGGQAWERLTAMALREFIGTRLDGQQILEIGTRYGKMATLFALLGGQVTGIDLREECLAAAEDESRKWGVAERVTFRAYDGELDRFAENSFDLVFTKSVLVVVPRLEEFLRKIEARLKPGGKVVFLENGRGGRLLHALRALKHRSWYKKARYFTDRELDLVRTVFQVKTVRRTRLPPVYLIMGYRRLPEGVGPRKPAEPNA